MARLLPLMKGRFAFVCLSNLRLEFHSIANGNKLFDYSDASLCVHFHLIGFDEHNRHNASKKMILFSRFTLLRRCDGNRFQLKRKVKLKIFLFAENETIFLWSIKINNIFFFLCFLIIFCQRHQYFLRVIRYTKFYLPFSMRWMFVYAREISRQHKCRRTERNKFDIYLINTGIIHQAVLWIINWNFHKSFSSADFSHCRNESSEETNQNKSKICYLFWANWKWLCERKKTLEKGSLQKPTSKQSERMSQFNWFSKCERNECWLCATHNFPLRLFLRCAHEEYCLKQHVLWTETWLLLFTFNVLTIYRCVDVATSSLSSLSLSHANQVKWELERKRNALWHWRRCYRFAEHAFVRSRRVHNRWKLRRCMSKIESTVAFICWTSSIAATNFNFVQSV